MSEEPPQVDPHAAATMIENGAVLLDVREPDEWQAGHAPSAIHIPLGDLGARHEELGQGPIVAVCRTGGRSNRAAAVLRQAGYDVVNLNGGMQAWVAAGQPVVTASGDPGRII